MKQTRIKKRIIYLLILALVSYSGAASASCEDSYDSSSSASSAEYRANKVRRQIAREREYRAILAKRAAGKPLTKKEKNILAKGFPSDSTGAVNQSIYEERAQKRRDGQRNHFAHSRTFKDGTTPLEREFYSNWKDIDPDLFPNDNY